VCVPNSCLLHRDAALPMSGLTHGATHSGSMQSDQMCTCQPQMRSSRNFCVDVVLICVLLAIAAYIYSMVKK
jgi:hypothetical protein